MVFFCVIAAHGAEPDQPVVPGVLAGWPGGLPTGDRGHPDPGYLRHCCRPLAATVQDRRGPRPDGRRPHQWRRTANGELKLRF